MPTPTLRRLLGSLVVLVSTTACITKLEVPAGVDVRCAAAADCPDGYECVAGSCKALNTNEPPQLTIGAISRSMGVVQIPISVSDAEADPVDLAFAVRPTAGADFAPLTISGSTGLSVGTSPTSITLAWTTAAQDLQALGHPGYVDGATLAITPRDAQGPGPRIETTFAFGNDAPELVDVVLDGTTVSGNTVVRFLVRDSASDDVEVDVFRVSALGDFSDAQDLALLTGPGAVFPGGNLTGLHTSTEGVWHNVTWNSHEGADVDDPSMAIGLRVKDRFGGLSEFVATAPFAADNAESAPTVEVMPITTLTGTVDTDVSFSVRISDLDGDAATLFVDYSLDHITWARAATSDDIVGLAPDVTHPFTWDIAQLPAAVHPTVWLRFEVRDNLIGEVEEVGPFVVDATTPAAVDTSPPNYITPASGTVFTTNDVLLQWTSRLGAASYTVEVATDASFTQPIAGSPFTPNPPDATELALNLSDDVSYYWRVRADVTTPGQYSSLGGQPAVFHLFLGTIYVYCPATDTECSNSGRIGNRSFPYRRLPAALTRAVSLGVGTVKVASRGGTAPYTGIIFLENGVDLLGGYAAGVGAAEPTFDEGTRDRDGNRTRLAGGISFAYGAVGVVAEDIVIPTVVEGFHASAPASSSSYGLRVVGSTSSLRFEHSTFAGNNAGGLTTQVSAGVDITVSTPVFVAVDASGAPAGRSFGYNVLQGSSADITGGTATSGLASFFSAGVNCDSGTVRLDGVNITAGSANFAGAESARRSVGVRADDPGAGCALTVINSAISGGTPVGVNARSAGISMAAGSVNITASTIAGAVSPSGAGSVGASFQNVTGSIVDTNFSAVATAEGVQAVGLQVFPGASLVVTGGTISAQSPTDDVGIWVNGATASFTNVDVTALPALYSSVAASLAFATDVSFDRCVLTAGDALDSRGLSVDGGGGTEVTRTRISAGLALVGGTSYGARFVGSSPNVLQDSLIMSRDAEVASAGIVVFDPGSAVDVDNVIVAAGTATTSAALYANGANTDAMKVSDSIFVRGPAAGDDCILQWNGNGNIDPSANLFVDCTTPFRSRAGGAVNNPYDQLCSGDLVQGTCGAPTQTLDCTPGACALGTATSVFNPGFSLTNFLTWTLLGGWQAGDPGVDVASTGLLP